MKPAHVLGFVMVLVAAAPARAEFTKSGQFVCRTLPQFRELEQTRFDPALALQMMQSGACTTLPPNYVAAVLERTLDGYMRFQLVDDPRQTFWTIKTGLVRRLQPEPGDIIVSGIDDAMSICKMVAAKTHSRPGSTDLARSIIRVQDPARTRTQPLRDAVEKNEFELVVRPSSSSCSAELDVENQPLASCIVDTRAYFGGAKDVCVRPAQLVRPDRSIEEATARAALRNRMTGDRDKVDADVEDINRKLVKYEQDTAPKAVGKTTRAACDALDRTLNSEPNVKYLLALAVEKPLDLAYATSERYQRARESREFSMQARWSDGRCVGLFEPSSVHQLPSLSCYVAPDQIRSCLDAPAGGNPFRLTFCLNEKACLK